LSAPASPRGRPRGGLAGGARPTAAGIGAVALGYVPLGLLLVGGLLAWWGEAYWNYSDGVYLLTARTLDGGLYAEVAAAQPPLLFWLGSAILSVSDSVLAVRAALALVALGTGWLVALCVWRLTAGRTASALAGVAALVTPWRLHESLTLTPESLAAPLLLGAALLAADQRRRRGQLAGLAAATAACFKLAFVVPALALACGAAARRHYATSASLSAAAFAALALALYGGAIVENVLTAQAQTGAREPGAVAALLVQAAWNLAPLLLPAGLAWWLRAWLADLALVRCLGTLLIGELLLVPTVLKQGTSLNLLAVVEPTAVVLAAGGVVALLRAARSPGSAALPRAAAAVVAACAVTVGLQSASLLLSPDDPGLFARPFSALAYQRTLSGEEVDAAVARAQACPPEVAYSGPPYLAFMAGRSMPADQPDQFILARARVHAIKLSAAQADQPRCP